jgi:hypothetical protein
VGVGDVDGLVSALRAVEDAVASERRPPGVAQIDRSSSVDRIPVSDSFAAEHGQVSMHR